MSPKQESPPPLARRGAQKAPPSLEYKAKCDLEQASAENRLDWCRNNLPKFRLKPDGISGEAACELHDDNRPSLWVGLKSTAGAYACQACGAEGTLAQYAELTGKPSFPAEAAGSPPPTKWVYTTAAGDPILRVTRRDRDGKKSFFQERWNGSAWVKGGVAPAPLLHAPKLAAAPAGSLCFVVEGERCAEHLTVLGLLATTAPMGAGKFDRVGRDWLELLLHLGVVILPDNDEPGLQHALQVAERLKRELAIESKILPLPGLKPKGDIADWLLLPRTKADLLALVPGALGIDEFRQRLNQSELPLVGDPGSDPSQSVKVDYSEQAADLVETPILYDEDLMEAPLPLGVIPDKPEFPLHALPEALRVPVAAIAEAYQVPVSYPASVALGAISTAVLKRVVVDPGRGPVCALNEWFLTSLESGSGKSSALHQIFGPIYAWERKLVEAAKPPADANVTGECLVGLVSSDPTPEAVERRLRANKGRYSIANPEAADLFAILAGKYSANGAGANIGIFLKAFSGDTHRSDRVLRGATYIDEPRLTMTLALQPQALDRVLADPEFRERGLMARFLLDCPESLLGYRRLDPEPVPSHVKSSWYVVLTTLLSIEPPETNAEPEPYRVNVSPQAHWVFRCYRTWAEEQLRPEGLFEQCREFGARAAEHLLKVAGLLHCAQHPVKPWEQVLSEATMKSAVEVLDYYASHVRLASGSGAERRRTDRLRYLLERIGSRWKSSFKARDLFLLVKKRRGFETMEALAADLYRLCEYGYLQEITPPGKRGRPSVTYRVVSLDYRDHQNSTPKTDPQNPQKPLEPYGERLCSDPQKAPNNDLLTLKNRPQNPAEDESKEDWVQGGATT